jgi:hypothetical protein
VGVRLGQGLGWHQAGFTFLLLFVLFVAGAVFGSLVTGAYLAASCAWLGAHGNDTFSAMGLTSYKNFLRLHIDREGVLHVYSLGIDRAHTNWACDPGKSPEAPWIAPVGGAPAPHLIHTPITIDGRTP